MKKYWKIFSLALENGFVYRASVLLWRLRLLLSTVLALSVWLVLFQSAQGLFGYSHDQMVTYIFLISFLQSVVMATSLNGLASEIYSGSFSFDLLKPLNIYLHLFIKDIADKVKNVFFVLIETVILVLAFHPKVLLPSLSIFLLFLVWVVGAVFLLFFIQLIFGSFGFHTPETWAPRFVFFVLVDLAGGKLFPLDILPKSAQTFLQFTPFPYFSFWQIQLFLGKLSPHAIVQHSITLGIWLLATAALSAYLWKRGIKEYDATGQ